jgi:AcrR family transcriptional regulator
MKNTATRGYHHGALREALLAAAEKLLREQGITAFTLRAIAREAGVSHGAPAHHFKDLSELLSDLAAVGFRRLVDQLDDAMTLRGEVRFPIAKAYVRFAMDNPALFSLMFREERLDPEWPALRDARRATVLLLSKAVDAPLTKPGPGLGAMTAVWSLAHGFAMLAIGRRLAPLLNALPKGTELDVLLEAALTTVDLGAITKTIHE